MGTIYQPEVAAEVIEYASHHNRREYYVGWPTVKAIVGNKIAPWYADWVLSRNGIKGQMTSEPEDPNRRNNLWEPLPGDHGAHGTFDTKSKDFSAVAWASLHKGAVAASLLAFAGAIFLVGKGLR